MKELESAVQAPIARNRSLEVWDRHSRKFRHLAQIGSHPLKPADGGDLPFTGVSHRKEVPDDMPLTSESSVWGTQLLRLIAFTEKPAIFADGDSWWKAVAGAEPNEVTRTPQKREWSGEHNGAALRLTLDPVRVHWTLSPILNLESTQEAQLPSLGPVDVLKTQFCQLVKKWLDIAPSVSRITFAAKLSQVAPTKEAAFRLLASHLRNTVKIDLNSSDIQYRVNRPRQSIEIPSISINRLATWSSASVSLSFTAKTEAGQENTIKAFNCFACLLDLDINSSQQHPLTALSPQDLYSLFCELFDLGTAISKSGDVAEAST